jgi:hypothetical protein
MEKRYTNRKGFIGVRPDGSLILASCSYYAHQSRHWISANLSVRGNLETWSHFYKKGYRVVRCIIDLDGGAGA